MKAVVFDKQIQLVNDYEKPIPAKGEALIQILLAGICNTDYQVTQGYLQYKGILGHEFLGKVISINDQNQSLINKRVAGQINQACQNCQWCFKDLGRHCPNRKTLGIWKKNGCFCQYITLPLKNLIEVPQNVSDQQAIFIQPFAAGLQILEQTHIQPKQKVILLGDGKLGLVTALGLHAYNVDLVVVGKHPEKLSIAKKAGIKTCLLSQLKIAKQYDFVIEATGSASGFQLALSLTKPRGTLILKSTVAVSKQINLAPIVIDQITVLGSRCGRFEPAMKIISSGKVNFSGLITKIYPIQQAVKAFEKNKEKQSLKVLLRVSENN